MKFLKRMLCGMALAAVLLLIATAQPFLHVNRQGTNVLITWSGTNSTNFTLQQTASLPASNWLTAPYVPFSNAGNFSVLFAATNPASFFRLYLPASNIVDEPDDQYLDTNGDGIDGDVARAIFVTATGNDTAAGTMAEPVRTLAEGIRRAAAGGKHVYVADGIYLSGTVHLTNGVSVYGGYQAGNWAVRSMLHSPAIVVSNAVGVLAASLTSTTHLDHLQIQVQDQTNASQSVYGLFATNCSALVVRGCEIQAGNAGLGGNGMSGTNGPGGARGQDGQPGCENSTFTCSDCPRPQGGPGGPSPCDQIGGVGGYPGLGGGMGQSGGPGAGGTLGGSGGRGSGGGNGVPGDPGAPGLPGTNGNAGSGTYTSNGYSPLAGAGGAAGQPGNGGGGGGGGGGGDDDCDSYGSSGGGGGGGGCAACRGQAAPPAVDQLPFTHGHPASVYKTAHWLPGTAGMAGTERWAEMEAREGRAGPADLMAEPASRTMAATAPWEGAGETAAVEATGAAALAAHPYAW